jgi:hypothetical protein
VGKDVSVRETLIRGSIGTTTSLGATIVSLLPQVEAWLRVVSLLVGIAVGVASFVVVVQKRRENRVGAERTTKGSNQS